MNKLLTWIYKQALSLYPSGFRREYRDQIILTLEDAYRESGSASYMFCCRAFYDLSRSIASERLRWMRRHLLATTVVTAAVASLALLVAAVSLQQVLRRGADEPQLSIVSRLATGSVVDLPNKPVEISRSPDTFVVFYEPDGKPSWSTGYLDGKIPSPPAGVFASIAAHGSRNFTWQPRPDVRLAAVARLGDSSHPGIYLAGRSLWEVEGRESRLRLTVLVTWGFVMALVLGALAYLRRRNKADLVS